VKLIVGTFNLTAVVDALFFIGSHLVALNRSGKLGVWHAVSQNWQVDKSFAYYVLSLNWNAGLNLVNHPVLLWLVYLYLALLHIMNYFEGLNVWFMWLNA